jgi:ribosomal-protein-alanine N-acetyltransferase
VEEISIKPCTYKEMNQILNIEKICFQEDAWSRDFINYAMDTHYVKGIFSREILLAYGACHVQGKIMNVDNLAVLPEYRGKGLGKLLLLHMMQLAEDKHCSGVILQVNVNNTRAIEIYRKLGFETVRLLKGYYQRKKGKSEDAFLMFISLPGQRTDQAHRTGE